MKHLAKQFKLAGFDQLGTSVIRTLPMRTSLKRNPTYEDTDQITFGKHRGLPLSDITSSYFRWLWDEGPTLRTYSGMVFREDSKPPMELYDKVKLANYIWNSQNSLAQELGEEFI